MTDAELVAAVRAGQTDALGRLFDRYAEPTWRLLSRMLGSAADADDALQDVFIGLPEILGSYSGRAPLAAWIRGVAVNTALMRLRTDRRRAEDPLDDPDMATDGVSPRTQSRIESRSQPPCNHCQTCSGPCSS